MRLGQLARRYDIPTEEISSYIKKIDPSSPPLHPNSKLDARIESLVTEYYDDFLGVIKEEPKETIVADIEDITSNNQATDSDIVESETAKTTPQEKEELPEINAEAPEPEGKKGEVIETDRLLELLESEEGDIDLSNITHIKVPKKELSGLKVIGKIEIEEPKKKVKEANPDAEEESPESARIARQEARKLREEEREKQRLRAKRKKEEYEARQQRRKKEQEERKEKELRKARYERRLEQTTSIKKAQKTSPRTEIVTTEVYHPKPQQPKTIFGKFWKWLNSY